MSRVCPKCHWTKFKLAKAITVIISLLIILNSPWRNSVSFYTTTDLDKIFSTVPIFCLEFFEIATENLTAGKKKHRRKKIVRLLNNFYIKKTPVCGSGWFHLRLKYLRLKRYCRFAIPWVENNDHACWVPIVALHIDEWVFSILLKEWQSKNLPVFHLSDACAKVNIKFVQVKHDA